MSNLTVFNFENNEVRFVGTPDNPWWVAADVCKVLEIQDSKQSTRYLDDDEKGMFTIHSLGGNQKTMCVNEPGLYSLILRSRKPQAKRFKKWITSEVIPQIRKTGTYSLKPDLEATKAKLKTELISQLATLADKKGAIQAKIDFCERELEKLKANRTQINQEYLTIAKQFVSQHSEIGELYTTCKADIEKNLNPWKA